MKKFSRTHVMVLAGLMYSQSASAYLDPGTGSLMLQMLIAGVMGALFTMKLYWYRVKAFVARILGRSVDEEIGELEQGSPEPDEKL
jgi:hypothetical protein